MSQTGILLQPSENPQRRQLVWGYLQHEILYLTWMLMEMTLLAPLLATILPAPRTWPPGLFLLWLLLLMYLPFNLVRLMSTLDWPRSRQQLILATAVFLIYVLSIRALFYQPASLFDLSWISQFFGSIAESDNREWLQNLGWFVVVAFVWWRGLRLVGKAFTIYTAGRRLRVGGLVIAPLIIWASLGRLPWSIVPFILLFFMVCLTAVALTRVEEIEKQHSGRSVSLNPKWLLTIIAAAFLLMLTTLLLTFIISGETLLAISGWLHPLWQALYAGATVVLNTILNLLSPILERLFLVIEWLINLIRPMMTTVLQALPEPFDGTLLPTPEAVDPAQVDAGPTNGFKLINILLMVAIILAITLTLGRVYRKAEFAARNSAAAAPTDASNAPARPSLGRRLLNRLGLRHGWRAAASIRRIYQQMCAAAAVSGYPRAEAETPFEYLTTLAKAWPENQADTRLVTEAYVKVRYGELPESPEELDAIRQAWKRLEAMPPIDSQKAEKQQMKLDSLK
ncbi:MAG: DUF4129 domain-containing protein [Anaerolineae bacterium]|nr:DUF4129 domain-containing protein [Anaerolineae bacterium]